MSSKETILQSIRQYKYSDVPNLPDLSTFESMHFENNLIQFKEALKSVGGKSVVVDDISKLDEKILEIFGDAKVIASNVPECNLGNVNLQSIKDPHDLNNVDLAIVKGEFGVAENGAVWVSSKHDHRALYFLAQNIVMVVPKENIVPTMHEAYEKVSFENCGFGLFISGPSKTADIEQSLVIGAHGPKSGYVFFV